MSRYLLMEAIMDYTGLYFDQPALTSYDLAGCMTHAETQNTRQKR